MPKKTISAAAVPQLQLTAHDDRHLRVLAELLEREALGVYEDFVFRDERRIDALRWKHKRSDGDIHAYKERKTQADPVCASAGPHETLASESRLPRVLVTGTIPGSLDDVMYGTTFQDTSSLQSFWASHNLRADESAVVAKLEGAALNDPYRFLGVDWSLWTHPLNLLQRRDLLTLSSLRITKLSNGERVGVNVVHSIQHRDLAELHELNIVRGTISILQIYRQFDVNRVEVFMIQFLDTRGSVPDYHHAQQSIKSLLPLGTIVCNAGFRKKLEWLVLCRQRDRQASTLCDAIEPQSSGTNDYCELCDKRLGTLFGCPGMTCRICYQRICSRCSVRHDLSVAETEAKTTLRPHDFCLECTLKARAMPTLAVAREDTQFRYGSIDKGRERILTTLMSADSILELGSFHKS